jgi:ribosomal subunit interface protein
MKTNEIQIKFLEMEPTEALKQYVFDKVGKYEHLLKEATNMSVTLKQYLSQRGVDNDFRVDMNVSLPKSVVRVEIDGNNMYAIIDEAVDILARRLNRYYGKKAYWEGTTPWNVVESDSNFEVNHDESENQYIGYIPTIALRKTLEDMTPLEEGEAIERMELLGYDQFLFKSKKT